MKITDSKDELNRVTVRAADEQYFEDAHSGGHAYGYLEYNQYAVYVFLGQEQEGKYLPSLDRYPGQVRYKYFRNCILRVAKTDELLDKGEYIELKDKDVILIY